MWTLSFLRDFNGSDVIAVFDVIALTTVIVVDTVCATFIPTGSICCVVCQVYFSVKT